MKQTGKIRLPQGFNPEKHAAALASKIRETQGEGWEIVSINMDMGIAHIQRNIDTSSVAETSGDTMSVWLDKTTKTAGIPAAIGRLETLHEGWRVVSVDLAAYRAVMRRMNDDTRRARDAVSTALGCKPWEVDIIPESKGYWLRLPPSYMPSKHGQKLDEAARMIGGPGWYADINPSSLEGQIVAGKLWTFDPAYGFPFGEKPRPEDQWHLRLGIALGERDTANREIGVDLEASAGLMVVGTPNSGKSVAVNAMVCDALAKGWQIAVSTTSAKSVDYTWCKPWVIDGGFGVDSPRHVLAMLRIVYEQGQQRVKLLHEHGKQKISELPENARPKPLLVVMDEVQQTFTYMEEPKSLPKDHPLRLEAVAYNTYVAGIKSQLLKIAAEMRFAGIRVLLATQMAQANTGISVPLKMTLPNRLLLGANPGKTARGHAFSSPETALEVPLWVQQDKNAARGCGVAELEGSPSVVFKSFYEPVKTYHEFLGKLGLPESANPAPTREQLAEYAPAVDGPAAPGGNVEETCPDDSWLTPPDMI